MRAFALREAAALRLAGRHGYDSVTVEAVCAEAGISVRTYAPISWNAAADVRFVLTGQAQSIQRISRALKAAGVGSARILAKAYWAPGKAGLD